MTLAGHGGVQNQVDIGRVAEIGTDGKEVYLQKQGFGEIFIGITGKRVSVSSVVRVVTGVRDDTSSDQTLYTFLLVIRGGHQTSYVFGAIKVLNFRF